MAHSDDPRERYRREQNRLDRAEARGDVSHQDAEAIRAVLDGLDPQVRGAKHVHDGEQRELSTNTISNYGLRLRLLATELDGPLLDLTNDEIEALLDRLLAGRTEIGPDDGYGTGTLGQFESALKVFFRHHEGHAVDADEIPMETSKSTSVDERDLWTVEEVEAMRSKIDSKRDECLFELLAYTGQRVRVIQTLRVKDVDPDQGATGRYWVNDEVEGRKNRTGHGPLLGAQGAVRRWLRVHPTGEPEDALITCTERVRYGSGEDDVTTPGEPLSQTTIREHILKPLAERADVEKKVHPHMFRHYFTTIAKKPKARGGFEMDSDHIKRLRGDSPGSNVMETTYAHLVDEDSAAHAEGAYIGKEPETALTPAGPCSVCGELLQAGAKACPNCGAKRAPDAEQSEVEELRDRIEELEAQKEIQQEVGAAKVLGGDWSNDELEALAGDDALLAKLIEIRSRRGLK